MEQKLTDSIYEFKTKNFFKLFFYASIVFLISFIINFPFEKVIKGHLTNTLSSNRNCPIEFNNLNLSVFPPRARIVRPKIHGRCFSSQKSLELTKIDINFSFPSFSPLGPNFKIMALGKGVNLNVNAVAGLSSSLIKIDNSKVDSKVLNTIIGKGSLLRGDFSLDTLLKVKGTKVQDGDILLKSTNFGVNQTVLPAVTIPDLDIKNFLLKASIKGKILNVKDLIIGSEGQSAPINANFTGQIRMNTKAPGRSNYDFNGQLKLSDKMFEDIGILSLVLPAEKQDQNGYFNLGLKGSFQGMPKATFKQ